MAGDMMRLLGGLVFLSAVCSGVNADHDSGAPLSWHVMSAGLDESRVAIYREKTLVGIFDFACDLTVAEKPEDDGNVLQLVYPASNPRGLLIVTCNVGAHSQYIAIVDPAKKSHKPAFSRTGSYFASWEIQDGELWISFDQACDTGPTVECPDGFETIFVQYPPS